MSLSADTTSRVLFSNPLTFPKKISLPSDFSLIEQEAELSWRFGQKFPLRISDRLARIYLIYRILKNGKNIDMVITGRYGEYFAMLQGLIPFLMKRHVLLDVEWYGSRKSNWVNTYKKLMNRLMARGSFKIGVFCEAEANNYSSYYGIDKNKFMWIPYCTDLKKKDFDVTEEDYIFTGGSQQRDYETLFHAVKDLPITVKIVAPRDKIDSPYIAKNMVVLGTTTAREFYTMMARSKLVVLSLQSNVRRCPGVITYVSAMMLGKAVIVNETEGASSYIINGKTGILAKQRDPVELKKAIAALLTNDELRKSIAHNASVYAAEHFSVERLISDLKKLNAMSRFEG